MLRSLELFEEKKCFAAADRLEPRYRLPRLNTGGVYSQGISLGTGVSGCG